jgi:hypothetical protein
LVTQDKFLPAQRDTVPQIAPSREAVHRFQRTFAWPTNITASLAGDYGALSFTLDSLPSYTDFTSLFDQYRFVEARVQFCPLTAAFGPSTSAALLPTVYTIIDPDDNTTPASIAELQQYQTLEVTPNGEPFQRTLTPKAALAAFSGAFTSYAQAPQRMWFDCSSPSVQFYGLKWGTSPVTVAGGLSYQLYSMNVTITCDFRHPR